jgi:hypothetical protein
MQIRLKKNFNFITFFVDVLYLMWIRLSPKNAVTVFEDLLSFALKETSMKKFYLGLVLSTRGHV